MPNKIKVNKVNKNSYKTKSNISSSIFRYGFSCLIVMTMTACSAEPAINTKGNTNNKTETSIQTHSQSNSQATMQYSQSNIQSKMETSSEIEYDKVSQAIGHLISYETKRKMDLSYGTTSALNEVFKTYHADISHLPKQKQALFFFIVDSNINVHGGDNLFEFYNFIYLACGAEYIRLLKQNSNNPYLKPERIKLSLKTIEEREPQLKFQAKRKGLSLNEYVTELKAEYGFTQKNQQQP